MDEQDGWRKKAIRGASMFTLVAASLSILTAAAFQYSIWKAEQEARAFCDEIPTGSPISEATSKARARGIDYTDMGKDYAFDFPAFAGSNKGVCYLSLEDGKVISQGWKMQYGE